MEILNVGPLELIIILVIMFILLGPKEMILTAQKIGAWIRGFVRSPMWKEILGYSQEIRELPKMIMDETGLKETLAEVQKTTQEAANEINTQIKAAADAARVPEAEHLRIDPNVVSTETAAQTPAPVGYVPEKEEDIFAKIKAAGEEMNALAAQDAVGADFAPAETPAAGESEAGLPVKRKRRTKQQMQEAREAAQRAAEEGQTAAENQLAEEAEITPKRTRRGRKPKAVEAALAEMPEAEILPETELPTSMARVDSVTADAGAEMTASMESAETTALESAPKIRKPRRKKVQVYEAPDNGMALQTSETSVSVEPVIDAQAVEPVPSDTAPVEEKPRSKRGRKPAVKIEAPVEAPVLPRRRGRPRKNPINAEADVVPFPTAAATPDGSPEKKKRGRKPKQAPVETPEVRVVKTRRTKKALEAAAAAAADNQPADNQAASVMQAPEQDPAQAAVTENTGILDVLFNPPNGNGAATRSASDGSAVKVYPLEVVEESAVEETAVRETAVRETGAVEEISAEAAPIRKTRKPRRPRAAKIENHPVGPEGRTELGEVQAPESKPILEEQAQNSDAA